MPYLEVNKVKNNVFEIEYPKEENVRTEESKFLYYPIEKNYIKLNLEYPKDVKKIIIIGENLENIEVHVNTIDENYGFDFDDVYNKLTLCKKINDNTFKVDKKITSVSIAANFKNQENRNIQIQFVEN